MKYTETAHIFLVLKASPLSQVQAQTKLTDEEDVNSWKKKAVKGRVKTLCQPSNVLVPGNELIRAFFSLFTVSCRNQTTGAGVLQHKSGAWMLAASFATASLFYCDEAP